MAVMPLLPPESDEPDPPLPSFDAPQPERPASEWKRLIPALRAAWRTREAMTDDAELDANTALYDRACVMRRRKRECNCAGPVGPSGEHEPHCTELTPDDVVEFVLAETLTLRAELAHEVKRGGERAIAQTRELFDALGVQVGESTWSESLDVVRTLRAELASAKERERASDEGWMIVAGSLMETFIGGPGNLPNCVVARLTAATTRAETAEARAVDLECSEFAANADRAKAERDLATEREAHAATKRELTLTCAAEEANMAALEEEMQEERGARATAETKLDAANARVRELEAERGLELHAKACPCTWCVETRAAIGRRSQLIRKGLYGGNSDPNRCVCAEKEKGQYAGTPHTHYAEPPHACARGCGCKAYEPAMPHITPDAAGSDGAKGGDE
jgi:hypothetical protein